VAPFFLTGTYFNVNTIDDYHDAQYALRASRFAGKRISMVIPAYNEEASIGYVVRDFKPLVHEVLVVDNSSQDRTSEVAAAAGARVERVRLTGYGDTIRHGLDRAAGDILVVVEGDFSFRSRDLARMLEYLKEADMIVGTRTTREMQGANMKGPVRWGNVIVAKGVEALWWSKQPRFTDVGCTYRALWKDTWRVLAPYIKSVGPDLSPEMMVAALALDQRIIEIPVSYRRRIAGESKHSANCIRIARTALLMLKAILRWRFAPPAPATRPRELPET
jgi:glycosyltransferase involved in cell wall biosynthesis